MREKPWQDMFAAGYIEEIHDASSASRTFRLTPAALRDLTTGQLHDSKTLVFNPRSSLPLTDLTAFECGMMLYEKGWAWNIFPRSVQARKALQHPTSQETGSWYTLGKTLVQPYLVCLLASSQLATKYGITHIPHYAEKPVKDFSDLYLTGRRITYKSDKALPAIMGVRPEFNQDDVAMIEDALDGGMSKCPMMTKTLMLTSLPNG